MQIVIIAGGEGKRMKPLTTHKSLYSFLGIPLVAHLFPHFSPQQNRILIVTSPTSLSDFQNALQDYSVEYAVQPEPNGMAGALIAAEASLKPDQPILIVSAAKLQDASTYQAMLEHIQKNPTEACLAVRKVETYKDGGYLQLDGDKVVAIIEKPGANNMPSPYYKLILDYFPRAGEFIADLKQAKTDKDDQYEVGLSSYLKRVGAAKLVVSGDHVSIKHAYNILDIMRMALTKMLVPGIHPTATVAKTAVLGGAVMIDAGAKILDHAVIQGPAYIGRNVVVGNGALVRESCIEEGSQVGYGSEVARSYLGPATKGHMMYIGDSIIEGSVNISAGTVLANYRFDHEEISVCMPSGKVKTGRKKFGSIIAKNSITGINSSLMPGTVIGSHVSIGSGCTIKGYIKDGSEIHPVFSNYEK